VSWFSDVVELEKRDRMLNTRASGVSAILYICSSHLVTSCSRLIKVFGDVLNAT